MNLPRIAVALVTAVATTAASAALPWLNHCKLSGPDRSKGLAMKREVEKKITSGLKDPDSARFKEEAYYASVTCDEGPHEIVCGWVNARNSFGGYTGFESYALIRTGDSYVVVMGDSTKDIGELRTSIDALKLCQSAGLIPK